MRSLPIIFALFLTFTAGILRAQPGEKTTPWHSFEKVEFKLNDVPARYIKPRKPLPGNPWVWRAHFPDWHIEMDSILLERGFHIAYINTNDLYGSPKAMMIWDAFYQHLVSEKGFAPKVALEGVSRGGLYVYGWAKRNPAKVSCIYAEAPVCDFKSWPGGKGKSKGDAKSWQQLLDVYGFSEPQALAFDDNPMDHLEGMAAYKIPILHVISLNDKLVPSDENTFPLVERYQKLGGPTTVYAMSRGAQTLEGHHFPIEHPEWWADFITRHSVPVQKPLSSSAYVAIRAGLPNAYRVITEQKKATVAFLGGSITHNPGWRDKVSRYLQEKFPQTAFTFIKAGIPSLGSLPHSFRIEQDVLSQGKVDLLFVEAAVNDRTNETDSLTQLRALEGIVRHARKANPAVDVILMEFADPDKFGDFRQGKKPVELANHERVAAHYQLPSIDLAREVYDRIAANEFSWEYDFKDLHPSPFGQEVYFQTMKHLLDTAFQTASSTPAKPSSGVSPLVRGSFNNGHYVPIHEASLQNGWKLVENWKPADGVSTRPGFVDRPMLEATTPGAALSLNFTGTAVGIALISGPDAGEVEYRIDQGPYQKMDLQTQWSQQLHLPWYKLFASNLPNKKHVLQLRMAPTQNPKSKGTACRIVYFLVN
ncbi:SGNH/GDSL hydrolase family protein [Larkinella humicola]|uniref:SGNH/GDSL hydrolase family protein n=1 Tax=Larkinella humicola TaxID=2607654 RepID=A0A5N1J9A8_9BACT|nr:SGNH/GDSL hydrolase family protein [Larkinella humicola]KAA9349028.1 SGNH/GDSL hydrolase family protein [Larkinella humicola]